MLSPIQKLLLVTFSTLFLMVATTLIAIAMNWETFRKVEQKRFHGQVINLTDQPIRFTHTEGTTILPPWSKSLDMGVLDADGIIIDRPLRIGHHVYKEGTFVLCDFGKLTLKMTPDGENFLEESPGTTMCRILQDYGFHPNLEALRNNVPLHLRKK